MAGEQARTHLTVAQVAQRWGVSTNFVRRLIWDQRLPSTRFGRAVRVSVVAADAFADACTGRAIDAQAPPATP